MWERIRAGGEVWRVGEGEDVLDCAHGEPVDLSQGRVEEMLSKSAKEVGAASLVVEEDPPQALDRSWPG